MAKPKTVFIVLQRFVSSAYKWQVASRHKTLKAAEEATKDWQIDYEIHQAIRLKKKARLK